MATKGSQGTINKQCTIQVDWIGYLEEQTFYVAHLSGSYMILGEPVPSAAKAQISASKEPVTVETSYMQSFALTVLYNLRNQARFQSAAINITCKQVTGYSDEDKDGIVIALSTVDEQFNSVQELPNLLPKTIPTELPPLRNVNHHIDPKPGSEWLPTWRPSAYKFGQQINNKLNGEIKSGRM